MPYSLPAPAAAPLPVHSMGRPGHRRSLSAFTDDHGPGTFAPLGQLPRRRGKPGPVFHFNDNDDDDSSSPDDRDTTSLKLKPNNSFHLSLNTENLAPPSFKAPRNAWNTSQAVPFPRSSPSPSPLSPANVTRPSFPRTASTPILLSNGKPLKSSLKSSSSSPTLSLPAQPTHLRARSAPSTPHPLSSSPSSSCPSSPSSPPPTTPKNVHFPSDTDGTLETVRLFNRSAKPASLSKSGLADDTETETEGEGATVGGISPAFPFPRFPTHTGSEPEEKLRPKPHYELDTAASSPVPSPNRTLYANIHLESISLSSPSEPDLSLRGTLLVRNITFEKTVALRFTLDDWNTTSEVSARHKVSLASLPSSFVNSAPSYTVGDIAATSSAVPQWDRFEFSIRLQDYTPTLHTRTLWLVARFAVPSSPSGDSGPSMEEWWDNNGGGNYRMRFKEIAAGEKSMSRRAGVVSSPAYFAPPPTQQPQYHTASTHAPHSPSQNALAQSQALSQRLKKMNLMNYAAPKPPPTSPLSLPSAALPAAASATGPRSGSPTPTQSPLLTPPAPRSGSPPIAISAPSPRPAAPPGLMKVVAPSPPQGQAGIALHWPWGAGTRLTSGHQASHVLPEAPKRRRHRREVAALEDGFSSEGSASGSSSGADSPGVRTPSHEGSPVLMVDNEKDEIDARTEAERWRPEEGDVVLEPVRAGTPVWRPTRPTNAVIQKKTKVHRHHGPHRVHSNSDESSSSSGSGGEELPSTQHQYSTTSTRTPNSSPNGSFIRQQAPERELETDSVYQAFVRQWCFAQGPAPSSGSGGANGVRGVVVG